ncbi:hypothetical protein [Polynucleobacter sp.]|uniref:hypothetical protein n=1 Tax=Polynucleobacter sp. TaxID=2029855 RepID=UPI003F6A4C4C
MMMTPERLEELAAMSDPDKLWQLDINERKALPPEKKAQLEISIALRRYAVHQQRLSIALKSKQSLLITPMSKNSQAVKFVDIPADTRPKLLSEALSA